MSLFHRSSQPRIILGLMTFGPDASTGARVTSLEDYQKCLDHFQGKGYHEVDTARSYVGGKQEDFTRRAGWKERGLTLATKLYPHVPGIHKPDSVVSNLNKSLEELGTDCVDIFYLHAADRSVPFETTLETVNELHKNGKFVRLGLSNFTAFEVAEIVMTCRQHGWVRPSIYQGMYNAITRSLATELIPACHRYGLDVVVYNPLAGGAHDGGFMTCCISSGSANAEQCRLGLFSGKVKTPDVPQEGRFSDTSKIGAMYRKRYFKDATFDALRIVEPMAEKHGLSMVEIALRWCVHHSALNIQGGNDGIIIGVSSIHQLENNLTDLEKGPLPDDVVKALDEAWLVTKGTSAPYWHLDLEYTYDTVKALFPAELKV